MSLLRPDIPTALAPYLLPGERVVAAVHQHWARVAEPVATAVAGLVVALWVDSNITASTQFIATVVWLAFCFLVARAGWRVLEWRHDWFLATDKRLLLRYGLVTHKVAMMPLLKVTDMSYVRSIPGQLLGYGRFIMESAGQDQALKFVNWVPNPDETYRAICAEIFHVRPVDPLGESLRRAQAEPVSSADDLDTGFDADADDLADAALDDGEATFSGTPADYPDVPPIHSPVQDRLSSWSRAVPIQGGEQVYASEDIRERRRGPQTGPVSQRPTRRRDRGSDRDSDPYSGD
ncbi:MAG: PH domain-containing protein [Intrasporangium sp.]|uniref:PH domain-containing protein n=1 Tax=Intrasporangium sp. TaxID=1925024 RepID=UPI003F7FA439